MENILLERIKSKKRLLDSMRPFPKQALKKLQKQFETELIYNSNAIEGNTLTLRETEMVLERGITVKGKSLQEHLEIINHKEALSNLKEFVKKKAPLTEKLIKQIHKAILMKINDGEAGRYRRLNVRILGAIKSPPQYVKVPKLMLEFIKDIQKSKDLHPVELSAKVHYEFVRIHPFFDGNGRTARLIMNLILMQKGYPVTIILNNDRKKYYDTLKKADFGDIKPFVNFVGRMAERSLNLYLSAFKKGMEFIELKEATKYCSYSQEYLSLLARKGILDSIKIGRTWFTTKKAIDEYLRKQSLMK
ncbi:MAG: Fic family protein [Candidatus Aenigmarchaeota archaeon]|nr:Fic family protein [Candidatus Aenigmarchaeota archaeon]